MKPKQRSSPPAYEENWDDKPLATYLNQDYLSNGVRDEDRPLIERVTNAWRHEKNNSGYSSSDDDYDEELTHFCDCDSEKSLVNVTRAALQNRRIRRSMITVAVLTVGLFIMYRLFLRPGWKQEQLLEDSFNEPLGTFGLQDWNKFADITQMKELAAEHMPGGEHDEDGKRRLIFVGDIHGCNDELLELMHKVKFDKDVDHLICTGDVVSKGPDSLGVVNTLISLNATSVRGNHEDKVLVSPDRTHETASLDPATRKAMAANLKSMDLARYFEPHHLSWLRSLPLILRIPPLQTPPAINAPPPSVSQLEDPDLLEEEPSSSEEVDAQGKKNKKKKHPKKKHARIPPILSAINVVHGGLVPGVPLLRQDPFSVMNMRSMSPSSHVPSSERDKGVAWEKIWNWYHDRLARHHGAKKWSWFGEDYEPSSLPPAHSSSSDEDDAATTTSWRSWLGHFFGRKSDDEWAGKLKVELPSVVVYGHDSPRGLNMHDWTKGLDSGCVRGGYLTALVLDAWGRAHLVQVGCKKHI